MALTLSRIIHSLERNRPNSAQKLLDACNFPLKHIGGGAFRDVYQIIGTDILVKIPRFGLDSTEPTLTNLEHSREEFKAWKKIRRSKSKKWSHLKEHLPEFLYHDWNTGVTLVRKYSPVRYSRAVANWCADMENSVTDMFNTLSADLHYANLGRDKNGTFRFIDLGLFITGM